MLAVTKFLKYFIKILALFLLFYNNLTFKMFFKRKIIINAFLQLFIKVKIKQYQSFLDLRFFLIPIAKTIWTNLRMQLLRTDKQEIPLEE